MSKEKLPTLFISHGTPTMAIEPIPAHEFLIELGSRYRDVEAVLCVSAHWATYSPAVNATETPETIHDFSGFPSELYRIEYPARGAPDLARRVAGLLEEAAIGCDVDQRRGLDHGAWVPMLLMFPQADVPVVQLSIQNHLDTAAHFALGTEPSRASGAKASSWSAAGGPCTRWDTGHWGRECRRISGPYSLTTG